MGRPFRHANATPGKKNSTLVGGAPISQSPVTRRYHLLAKVAESVVEKLTVSF
jgi:hypothetical protein